MTVSETLVASSSTPEKGIEGDMPTLRRSTAEKSPRVLTASKKKEFSPSQAKPTPRPNNPIIAEKKTAAVKTLSRSTNIKNIAALNIQKKRTPNTVASRPASTEKIKGIASKEKKAISSTVASNANFKLYRVKNGDTLWTISRKFNTSLVLIKQWNNMKSDILQPGSELKLKKV